MEFAALLVVKSQLSLPYSFHRLLQLFLRQTQEKMANDHVL
jgi:hypothetical protein